MTAPLTKVNEVAFLSNEVVRSPLALSNVEARIFALALGCLHQKQDSLDFTIHFQDITPGGRQGGSVYAELSTAQTRLTQPLIIMAGRVGRRRRDALSMFTRLTLDEGTRQITGKFNPELREHLLNLAGYFTTVELQSLLTFKSAHTQRLFWILRSYHNQQWNEPVDFEQLREWLFGTGSEQYSVWTDFNRYVLKPALEEFLAVGWEAKVTVQKRGRRVDSLLFALTNLNAAKAAPALATSKKSLTLVEIAAFRTELATKYKDLPPLYDRLRSDFELKEYQAREVVKHIDNLEDFRAVQKVLYDVVLDLTNNKPIKSLAAYTLSKLKAVLPVYQQVSVAASATGATAPAAPRDAVQLRAQLDNAQLALTFIRDDAPAGLYSEQEQQQRKAELEAEIATLTAQLDT